jgi:NCS1 family nucleobase:cation symporter-1
MLKAIWPNLRSHVPNHLPGGANITTLGKPSNLENFNPSHRPIGAHNNPGITCFFIFWTFQLLFILVPPHKFPGLFLAKALTTPPALLALLIWALIKVPSSEGLFKLHATVSGNDLSWAYLSALSVVISSYSTTLVNISDFMARSSEFTTFQQC